MKLAKRLLCVLAFASSVAMAAPASEASIHELLEVTQVHKLLDGIQSQYAGMMDAGVQQALKGKVPTARQQQAIDKMKTRMLGLMKDTLAWGKLEPSYVRLYTETFSEDEVAGMLAFYRTPAGQAVINKMPLLMQKNMVLVQQILAGVTPQIQQIQRDFIAEIKAAN